MQNQFGTANTCFLRRQILFAYQYVETFPCERMCSTEKHSQATHTILYNEMLLDEFTERLFHSM